MNVWLILSPLFAWLTFGGAGYVLLRTSVPTLWQAMQITTAKRPYDSSLTTHRLFAVQMRIFGFVSLLLPFFITVMAILVATGIVPPPKL